MSGPTFEVFTLFPDAIAGFLRGGLIGKAAQQGLVTVHQSNLHSGSAGHLCVVSSL